jgi:hypothetical protein
MPSVLMVLLTLELSPLLRNGLILGAIIYRRRKNTMNGTEGIPSNLNDANQLFRSLSTGNHKPNNLRYNNSMEIHCQSLFQEGQASDVHALVKLQQLLQQVNQLSVRSLTNLSSLAPEE